jgi:hypothetical protein
VGVNAALPIFNRNQGNVMLAQANVRQTQLEFQSMERRVVDDVSEALRDFELSRAAVVEMEEHALPAARRTRDLAFEQYRKDPAKVDRYTRQQQGYNQVVQQYRDLLLQHRQDTLSLNTAVGVRIMPRGAGDGPGGGTLNMGRKKQGSPIGRVIEILEPREVPSALHAAAHARAAASGGGNSASAKNANFSLGQTTLTLSGASATSNSTASQASGTPTTHQRLGQNFTAVFYGPYIIGPPRFEGDVSQAYTSSGGTSRPERAEVPGIDQWDDLRPPRARGLRRRRAAASGSWPSSSDCASAAPSISSGPSQPASAQPKTRSRAAVAPSAMPSTRAFSLGTARAISMVG